MAETQFRLLVSAALFSNTKDSLTTQIRTQIVDSLTALFRVDFSGRGELADRQQKLAQFMSRLTKLSEEFNVAVFITNQVISDPGGGGE